MPPRFTSYAKPRPRQEKESMKNSLGPWEKRNNPCAPVSQVGAVTSTHGSSCRTFPRPKRGATFSCPGPLDPNSGAKPKLTRSLGNKLVCLLPCRLACCFDLALLAGFLAWLLAYFSVFFLSFFLLFFLSFFVVLMFLLPCQFGCLLVCLLACLPFFVCINLLTCFCFLPCLDPLQAVLLLCMSPLNITRKHQELGCAGRSRKDLK